MWAENSIRLIRQAYPKFSRGITAHRVAVQLGKPSGVSLKIKQRLQLTVEQFLQTVQQNSDAVVTAAWRLPRSRVSEGEVALNRSDLREDIKQLLSSGNLRDSFVPYYDFWVKNLAKFLGGNA